MVNVRDTRHTPCKSTMSCMSKTPARGASLHLGQKLALRESDIVNIAVFGGCHGEYYCRF